MRTNTMREDARAPRLRLYRTFCWPESVRKKFTNRLEVLAAYAAGIVLLSGCGGGWSDATGTATAPASGPLTTDHCSTMFGTLP